MSTATMDEYEVEEVKRSSILWPILKYSTVLFGSFAATIFAAFTIVSYSLQARDWATEQANITYSTLLSYIPKQTVVQMVTSNQASIESILDMVSSEMRFDPVLLKAMAIQESGGFTSNNRVKDEPQLLEWSKDKSGNPKPPAIVLPKDLSLNRIERLLWASSHGVLQVIFGFHYKTCGLAPTEWDRLHDPLINIRCGAKVLKSYADRYKSEPDQSKRVWLALRDYNGSEEYANSVMLRISRMKKINFGSGI